MCNKANYVDIEKKNDGKVGNEMKLLKFQKAAQSRSQSLQSFWSVPRIKDADTGNAIKGAMFKCVHVKTSY